MFTVDAILSQYYPRLADRPLITPPVRSVLRRLFGNAALRRMRDLLRSGRGRRGVPRFDDRLAVAGADEIGPHWFAPFATLAPGYCPGTPIATVRGSTVMASPIVPTAPP